MKTTAEFIEGFVKVEYMEDDKAFGHYPFQLYVENRDGTFDLNALLLGGDVEAVYRRVRHYIKARAKLIFLSVDFPAGGDIPHDFVCVFSLMEGAGSIIALLYDPKTGERFPEIHESSLLQDILTQFRLVTCH
jgi:hypothetical protein